MAAGPCLNPNCKSHGRPHPNCHCYDGMADGGTVEEYCTKGMPHKAECHYFVDGGEVPKYEDSTPMGTAAPTTPEVPKYEDSTPIAADPHIPKYEDSTPVEPPKYEESTPLSHKFDSNTVMGNVNAAAEGAYSGATFGMAPHLPGMGASGEAEAASPIAYHAGEVAGMIANPVRLIGMAGPVVTSALQAGAMATGDELHDYLAGNKHVSSLDDDKVAAMHILGAGGVGALLGKGQKFVGDVAAKFAPKVQAIAEGIGASSTELSPDQLSALTPLARNVYKAFRKIAPAAENQVIRVLGGGAAGSIGYKAGHAVGEKIDDVTGNENHTFANSLGVSGSMAGTGYAFKVLQPLVEKTITPFIDANIKKIITPVVIKAISTGQTPAIKEAINYAAKAQAGRKILGHAVDALFGASKALAPKGISEATDPKNIEAIEKYINDGGINPSIDATVQQDNDSEEPANYAHGGEVADKQPKSDDSQPKSLNSKLSHIYPEQHQLNVQNKTKLSNYLQQLKPQKKVGGPMFDTVHADPIAERSYKRAIHAAIDPTRILDHAKKGTLAPDHVKHMNSMYPSVMDLYRHEITKKLMNMQLEGKKPPLKLRQSLSMIMGADLDSSTTSMSIMAAQATFAPKGGPQQQGQKGPAKSTAKLDKVAANDTTASQAGTARRQGQKS